MKHFFVKELWHYRGVTVDVKHMLFINITQSERSAPILRNLFNFNSMRSDNSRATGYSKTSTYNKINKKHNFHRFTAVSHIVENFSVLTVIMAHTWWSQRACTTTNSPFFLNDINWANLLLFSVSQHEEISIFWLSQLKKSRPTLKCWERKNKNCELDHIFNETYPSLSCNL